MAFIPAWAELEFPGTQTITFAVTVNEQAVAGSPFSVQIEASLDDLDPARSVVFCR